MFSRQGCKNITFSHLCKEKKEEIIKRLNGSFKVRAAHIKILRKKCGENIGRKPFGTQCGVD